MKKMSFTITTTLKDKLALMSKIYMSNRKSEYILWLLWQTAKVSFIVAV